MKYGGNCYNHQISQALFSSICFVLVSIDGCDRKVSFGKRGTNKMSFGGDRAEGPGRCRKMNWQTLMLGFLSAFNHFKKKKEKERQLQRLFFSLLDVK